MLLLVLPTAGPVRAPPQPGGGGDKNHEAAGGASDDRREGHRLEFETRDDTPDRQHVAQERRCLGGARLDGSAGRPIDLIELPEHGPTNCCFGGDDFRTLYVTSSDHGNVFAIEWDRPGMRLFSDR